MEVTSPAFGNDQPIPETHTNKGAGTSPSLLISNIPSGTQSLAIVMHDPDAPSGDFVHWLVWNISGSSTVLPEDHLPNGALQGKNDFGNATYGPPAPPSGTHRYIFDVYALNTQLALPAGTDRHTLLITIEGHVLAQSQLTGTVTA